VDRVGEVDGGRAGGQTDHVPLRGEDEDLSGEDIRLQVVQKLRGAPLGMALQGLPDPGEPLVHAVDPTLALLVVPVGRDAVLRQPVHLPRADLDLQGLAAGAHHGGVQGLVHVVLRVGHVVVELAGDGLPDRVDNAQDLVALGEGVDDHPKRQQVVELIQGEVLAAHLLVDAVEVLRPPVDVGVDAVLVEPLGERVDRLLDDGLPFGKPLADPPPDLVVHLRIQDLEGEILQFPLDLIDPQAMGQGGVDLQGLLGDGKLFVPSVGREGSHVVEPIGQLDEDHPDVPGHHQEHLAQVFRLVVLDGLEGKLAQLGHAVHQRQDPRAEAALQDLRCDWRVLQDVVQERRGQGLLVQLHVGQVGGHVDRVNDIGLSAVTPLFAVGLRREDQGLADPHQVLPGEIAGGLAPELLPGEPHGADPLRLGQTAEEALQERAEVAVDRPGAPFRPQGGGTGTSGMGGGKRLFDHSTTTRSTKR